MVKLVKSGDFNTSTDPQLIGSLNTVNGCVNISLIVKQKVDTTPTPFVYLNIYKGNERLTFTSMTNNNLNKMVLVNKIKVLSNYYDSFGNYYTNELTDVVDSEGNCLVFTIENPNLVSDLDFYFTAYRSVNNPQSTILRDGILELDKKAVLTRNISDYKTEIMDGQHKGMSIFNMSCKGDLTNTEYLIYEDAINTLGYFDTANGVHKANQIIAKSTVSTDNSSGIGARTIKILGLNNNFEQVEETIILNGTTEIFLQTQMTDVNSAEVLTSGSLYCNSGTITIYNNDTNGGGSTNPMCSIPLNYGFHQNSQYTVPKGYSLIIQRICVQSHCEDECELLLNKYMWGTNDTNVNKHRLKTYHLHSSNTWKDDLSFIIPEKCRFTITGQVSTAPTGINRVSVNVFGYLKLNNFSVSSNYSHNQDNFINGLDTLPMSIPYHLL